MSVRSRTSLLSLAAATLLGFVPLTPAGVPSVAWAAEQTADAGDLAGQASSFIDSLGQKTITHLATAHLDQTTAKQRFRDLLTENFDIPRIGQFVLGRYWNVATEDQRQEYQQLFEKLIVEIYATRFANYNGESLKILGSRPDGSKDAVVTSQILRPYAQPVDINWRVRRLDTGLKIEDVVVENVSMATSQRDDFSSVIQSNGGQVEGLLKELRQRVANAEHTQTSAGR